MTATIPDISVIIAFFNRRELVEMCLGAVLSQSLSDGRTFEVIAVDNGSTDGTLEMLQSQTEITVVQCAKRGAASARNAGIDVARGTVIAITDSDCEPQPGWLDKLTRPLFAGLHIMGCGGRIDALHLNRGVEMYSQFCGILNQGDFFGGVLCFPPYFATANVAWRAEIVRQVGGFDVNVGVAEDSDLSWRIFELGATIAYIDSAVVKHAHRQTPIELFRQSVNYGEGAVRVFAKHRDKMGTGRVFFSWASYYEFLSLPFRCLGALVFANNSFQRIAPLYEWIWRSGNLYGVMKECVKRRVIFFP